MNLESLPDRVSKAGLDLYTAVTSSVEDKRGVHLETAIAALGYLAGTALLKACGANLSHLSPGAAVFVDQVNETGPTLVKQILDRVAAAGQTTTDDLNSPALDSIPHGHQPRQSYEALILLLWPQFEAILARHAIPSASAPLVCAAPIARLILEGQAYLSPAIAKTIAIHTIVKASKTVPPAAGPYPPVLDNRTDFLRILAQTLEQIDALATREPAYPAWRELQHQLQAMRQWTADGCEPKPEQLQRISIGLIAARELEPAQNAVMDDLVTRLHLLSHYWSNGIIARGVPRPKKTTMTHKIAATALLAVGAVLLAWLAIALTLQVKVPHGFPLGPAVRAGKYSATLIATLQPYTVSFRHDPSRDRYRVSLSLHPAEAGSADRIIDLARDLRVNYLHVETRILGADTKYLWLFADGIRALNLRTEELIGVADLRRANPTLHNLSGVNNSNNPLVSPTVHRIDRPNNDLWSGETASRRFAFATRLRVTTPDFNHVLEIDPESLKAIPVK